MDDLKVDVKLNKDQIQGMRILVDCFTEAFLSLIVLSKNEPAVNDVVENITKQLSHIKGLNLSVFETAVKEIKSNLE